jgi:hypothetical protein
MHGNNVQRARAGATIVDSGVKAFGLIGGAFAGEHVTFQWKDYAHGDQRRTMTLSAMDVLRRFVQHIGFDTS